MRHKYCKYLVADANDITEKEYKDDEEEDVYISRLEDDDLADSREFESSSLLTTLVSRRNLGLSNFISISETFSW